MKKLSALLCVTALAVAVQLPAQSLVGAWSFGNTTTEGSGVVVFFNSGYYAHITDAAAAELPSGFDGYERGTYNWSGVNGSLFHSTTLTDTNGTTGLSSINQSTTQFSLTGNNLTITDADGLGSGSEVLARVTGASAIVGAWYQGDITVPNMNSVVVFLPNNTYFMMADRGTDLNGGVPGIERGTYTWNSSTGAFSATAAVDTNGSFGFSHPPLITNITVSNGVMSLTDSEGTLMINSVSAIPEPSTYAAIAGVFGLGFAMIRRRRAQQIA